LARVEGSEEGLTEGEARRRLELHGRNVLKVRRPVSAWTVLRHQFASIVVGLLVVATGLAYFIGDSIEAAAIAVVLAINVTVGFWTEWRARIAVEALQRLQVDEAVVLRAGHRSKIDARDLVPGDVILLSEGASIPADARLLRADELRIDESLLTGESVPVAKAADPVPEPAEADVPVADRTSMVFKGTTVAGGAGRAVVTGTGMGTEVGRIGELVGSLEHQPTPIERRLDVLGRRLVWLTLLVAAVVMVVGFLGGQDAWLVVETALALAIAAVPEGLPVVATITLAIGMWRMARRNALVRRPPSVEALGSATVICADKTGTLTTGRMAATCLFVADRDFEVPVEGEIHAGEATSGVPVSGLTEEAAELPALRAALTTAVLANEARLERRPDGWSGIGDPTDLALLDLALGAGMRRTELLEERPELARLPFSSLRMLMASFHRGPDGHDEVHVKGATDRLLPRCAHVLRPDGRHSLDEGQRAVITRREEELATDGLRVLALATGPVDPEDVGREEALHGLTFLGLVGLMDPPAPRVAETVARFRSAGLRTLMITGDQPATARAIAQRLGMMEEGERVVPGGELARMSMDELVTAVGEAHVFGRVSPEDKLRIVEALQTQGEVVGMLGDGVNDAPALKRADIGVAMGGRGTDVAKSVADLVLADDRLETVGVAVEEGRIIFDNIRKFVFYLFSCNLSEVGVVLGASMVGAPLPILPLQLLWLNVVTDVFPALALSAEPGEPDVMLRPPRPRDAAILSRGFMRGLGGYATLITASTLGVFTWGLLARGQGEAHAVTLAFMTLALSQLTHALNARTFGPLRLGKALFANSWLWWGLGLSFVLQLLAVYVPTLQRVLGTVPLSGQDWMVVGSAALLPLVAGQAWKRSAERRRERHR
jgi:Ca2+-transporting ATPase